MLRRPTDDDYDDLLRRRYDGLTTTIEVGLEGVVVGGVAGGVATVALKAHGLCKCRIDLLLICHVICGEALADIEGVDVNIFKAHEITTAIAFHRRCKEESAKVATAVGLAAWASTLKPRRARTPTKALIRIQSRMNSPFANIAA